MYTFTFREIPCIPSPDDEISNLSDMICEQGNTDSNLDVETSFSPCQISSYKGYKGFEGENKMCLQDENLNVLGREPGNEHTNTLEIEGSEIYETFETFQDFEIIENCEKNNLDEDNPHIYNNIQNLEGNERNTKESYTHENDLNEDPNVILSSIRKKNPNRLVIGH